MTYPHIANIFLGGDSNLCQTLRLESGSYSGGSCLRAPLTGRVVHLFSFWSMSGLKRDAVNRRLGGCQLGSVFVWWTDHDFWLLVGYGALTNSGLFINGASVHALFLFSTFVSSFLEFLCLKSVDQTRLHPPTVLKSLWTALFLNSHQDPWAWISFESFLILRG